MEHTSMIRRRTFISVNAVLKIDKEAKIMKNATTAALHTGALSLILYLAACAVKPAIDTEYASSPPLADESVKKTILFNGIDLSGWEIHGTEKWYVEGGELVCESGQDHKYGYLSTVKQYKDFDFSLLFKQESDGNSGVFFRSTFEDTLVKGWQVEVAPKGKDTGGIYESYGRGWLEKIPDSKEAVLAQGSWNKLRVKVIDDHVQTWLNGIKMVDLFDKDIGKGIGSIALQIHSGDSVKVRWRDLHLIEFNDTSGN